MIDALHKSQAPIWHEDAVLPSRDALRKESPCDSAAAAVSAASPDASVEKSWADTCEDMIKREEEGSRIGIAGGAGTDGRCGLGGGGTSKESVTGRVRSGNMRKLSRAVAGCGYYWGGIWRWRSKRGNCGGYTRLGKEPLGEKRNTMGARRKRQTCYQCK